MAGPTRRSGISLLEMVIVVAVMAAIAAVAVARLGDMRDSIRDRTARIQAEELNACVRAYRAAAGAPMAVPAAENSTADEKTVVAILRSRVNATSERRAVNVSARFLDQAGFATDMDPAERASDAPRLVWDGDGFVVSRQPGAAGIALSRDSASPPAVGEVQKDYRLAVAAVDPWIWDYTDHDLPERSGAADPEPPDTSFLTAPVIDVRDDGTPDYGLRTTHLWEYHYPSGISGLPAIYVSMRGGIAGPVLGVDYEIRYTIDGGEPTRMSPLYSGVIEVGLSQDPVTIRSKAFGLRQRVFDSPVTWVTLVFSQEKASVWLAFTGPQQIDIDDVLRSLDRSGSAEIRPFDFDPKDFEPITEFVGIAAHDRYGIGTGLAEGWYEVYVTFDGSEPSSSNGYPLGTAADWPLMPRAAPAPGAAVEIYPDYRWFAGGDAVTLRAKAVSSVWWAADSSTVSRALATEKRVLPKPSIAQDPLASPPAVSVEPGELLPANNPTAVAAHPALFRSELALSPGPPDGTNTYAGPVDLAPGITQDAWARNRALLATENPDLLHDLANFLVPSPEEVAQIVLEEEEMTRDPAGGFNGPVYDVAVDSRGNIYAVGDFTAYRGQPAKRIVKLDPTGNMVTNFDAVTYGYDMGPMNVELDDAHDFLLVWPSGRSLPYWLGTGQPYDLFMGPPWYGYGTYSTLLPLSTNVAADNALRRPVIRQSTETGEKDLSYDTDWMRTAGSSQYVVDLIYTGDAPGHDHPGGRARATLNLPVLGASVGLPEIPYSSSLVRIEDTGEAEDLVRSPNGSDYGRQQHMAMMADDPDDHPTDDWFFLTHGESGTWAPGGDRTTFSVPGWALRGGGAGTSLHFPRFAGWVQNGPYFAIPRRLVRLADEIGMWGGYFNDMPIWNFGGGAGLSSLSTGWPVVSDDDELVAMGAHRYGGTNSYHTWSRQMGEPGEWARWFRWNRQWYYYDSMGTPLTKVGAETVLSSNAVNTVTNDFVNVSSGDGSQQLVTLLDSDGSAVWSLAPAFANTQTRAPGDPSDPSVWAAPLLITRDRAGIMSNDYGVYVTGNFTEIGGSAAVPPYQLYRFDETGAFDAGFSSYAMADGRGAFLYDNPGAPGGYSTGRVRGVKQTPGGKLLVYGEFTRYKGAEIPYFIAIDPATGQPFTQTGSDRPATASFVREDRETRGTWTRRYGTEGYYLPGVTSTITEPIFFWNPLSAGNGAVADPGGVRWDLSHPQVPGRAAFEGFDQVNGSTRSRLYQTWSHPHSTGPVLDVADDSTRRVSVYVRDVGGAWGQGLLEMVDHSTGLVIASRQFDSFAGGVHLVYDISGSVEIRLRAFPAGTAGMVTAIFVGERDPGASSASYLGHDNNTKGDWLGRYGADGYLMPSIPNVAWPCRGSGAAAIYATNEINAVGRDWRPDIRAPILPGRPERTANAIVNYTQVGALEFFVDGDGSRPTTLNLMRAPNNLPSGLMGGATCSVQIADAVTGASLDSRALPDATPGLIDSWEIVPPVHVRFDRENPSLVGIFLGGAPADRLAAPSASLVGEDRMTKGDWAGTYGARGHDVSSTYWLTSVSFPSSPNEQGFPHGALWTRYADPAPSADPRLLPQPGVPANRFASGFPAAAGGTNTYIFAGAMAGARDVSLLLRNWNGRGGAARVIAESIADPRATLWEGSFSNLAHGAYATWNISGDVAFHVISEGGQPTAVMGAFWGGRPPPQWGGQTNSPAAAFLGRDRRTKGDWIGVYGQQGGFLPAVSNWGSGSGWVSARDPAYSIAYAGSGPRWPQRPGGASRAVGYLTPNWGTTVRVDVVAAPGQTQDVTLAFFERSFVLGSLAVDARDAVTGELLGTQVVSNMWDTEYLSWRVTRDATLEVRALSGYSYGWIDGWLLGRDEAAVPDQGPPAFSARLVDRFTKGSWRGRYGTTGSWLFNREGGPPLAAGHDLYLRTGAMGAPGGGNDVNFVAPGSLRHLETSDGSLRGLGRSDSADGALRHHFAIGRTNAPEAVGIYLCDRDMAGTAYDVRLVDPRSGATLDSVAVAPGLGAHVGWIVDRDARIDLVRTASAVNARSHAAFWGREPSAIPAQAASSATHLGDDGFAWGDWVGRYGQRGAYIPGHTNSLAPHGAELLLLSSSWGYSGYSYPADPRALQPLSGTNRIANTHWEGWPETMDVYLYSTNALDDEVAIYAADFGGSSPSMTASFLDPVTGAVLAQSEMAPLRFGRWGKWRVGGDVLLRLSGGRPILNGVFRGTSPYGRPSAHARFLGEDRATLGSWPGVYGTAGINVLQDASSLTNGAAWVSVLAQQGTWAGSTADPRAPVRLSGAGRIAAYHMPGAWSSGQAALRLDLPSPGVVGLYSLGWDSQARHSRLRVLDMDTGAVLDSRDLMVRTNGVWYLYEANGPLLVELEGQAYPAPISAVALGRAAGLPPLVRLTAPAADSGIVLGGSVALAAEASQPGGSIARVEFYDGASLIGQDETAPYSLDWIPAAAGSRVLTARAVDGGGLAAISGGVRFVVAPGPTAWATFLHEDRTTRGNWKGIYGADGGTVVADSTLHPPYATLSSSNVSGVQTWQNPSTDNRAQQRLGAGQVAARSYAGGGGGWGYQEQSVLVSASDTNAHRVAVYLLSWDAPSEDMGVDVLDAGTGMLLDRREAANNTNGTWLAWDFGGSVRLRLWNIEDNRAYHSAVLLGPGGSLDPLVSLLCPADGLRLTRAPASGEIEAVALGVGGTAVTNVTFYANGAPVASVGSAPWRAPWEDIGAGIYDVWAVATDGAGRSGTSATNRVHVLDLGDRMPPGLRMALYSDQGVATNASGQVTLWADSSGNGMDATNAGPAMARLRDDVADWGAEPWVDFYPGNYAAMRVPEGFGGLTNGWTMVWLGRAGWENSRSYLSLGAESATAVIGVASASDEPRVNTGTNVATFSGTSAAARNQWATTAITHGTGGVLRAYLGGQMVGQMALAPPSPAASRATNYVGRAGSGWYQAGQHKAVLFFDRELSGAEIGDVSQELRNRFWRGPVQGGGGRAVYAGSESFNGGSWRGVYGSAGWDIATIGSSVPAGVGWSQSSAEYTRDYGVTAEPRGIEHPGAATRHGVYRESYSAWARLNCPSRAYHVSFYFLDWLRENRAGSVEVRANGQAVGSWPASAMGDGHYKTWTVTGPVEFRFSNTSGHRFPWTAMLLDEGPAPGEPWSWLTSPEAGRFAPGGAVALAAGADDEDGAVALVEFYVDDQKVGEDATAPYAADWVPGAGDIGIRRLRARAIDDGGRAAFSAPRFVKVSALSVDYLGENRTFSGSWRGRFGTLGRHICNEPGGAVPPPWGQETLSGASAWTWAASTSDARALERGSGADRIATCWYNATSMSATVDTGTARKEVTFYLLDYAGNGRGGRIDAVDPDTGEVLDSRTTLSHGTGTYVTWAIRGRVRFDFVRTSGQDFGPSAVFYDEPADFPLAAPADGSMAAAGSAVDLAGDPSGLSPAAASVEYVYGGATVATAPAAPWSAQWAAAGGGVAALMARAIRADGGTNWSTRARFTVSDNWATFVGTDASTGGDWKKRYGFHGYEIVGDASRIPAFCTATHSGSTPYTWGNTTATRAPQREASGRIASCRYNSSPGSVRLTASRPTRVSFYLLDWDNVGLNQTITVTDSDTGAVLDSRSASSLYNGLYLTWDMKGDVTMTFSRNSGSWWYFSALFFDPAPDPLGPAVTLDAPADGAVLEAGAPTPLGAGASDPDGPVAGVEFLSGTNVVGSAAAAPWQASWSPPAGGHVMRARAWDGDGRTNYSSPASVVAAQARVAFAGEDRLTQGDWMGSYGTLGYQLVNDAALAPPWGAATWSSFSYWTWGTTSETRALQRPGNSNRIAACAFTGATGSVSVNTGSTGATVSLYFLDWDGSTRGGVVDVVDVASGTVIESRPMPASYRDGVYLTWAIRGSVRFDCRYASGPNFTVSGIFYDPGPSWVDPSVSLSSPARGSTVLALAPATLRAAVGDPGGAMGTVEFLRGTNAVASSGSAPWEASWTAGTPGKAVMRARSISAAGATNWSLPAPVMLTGGSATFAGYDASTRGDWIGTYGTLGYSVFPTPSMNYDPPWGGATIAGGSWWNWGNPAPFGDARCLLKPSGSERVAYCNHNGSTIRVNAGTNSCQFGIYFLNYDRANRSGSVGATDTATGHLMDIRSVTNYGEGLWLKWRMTGDVTYAVNNTNGISYIGIFYDP